MVFRDDRKMTGGTMADVEARKAAIKKASQQVRAGGVFRRATAASKVSASGSRHSGGFQSRTSKSG
jgi:hypothetical protein